MWIKDPKSNKSSVTLTLLVYGFVIATAKLLVSGVEFSDFKFGEFNGTEYSTALAALAGLYWARKRDSKKEVNNEDTPSSNGSSGNGPTNQAQ